MQKYKVPKELKVYLDILNQLFEIEKKLNKIEEQNSITRNLNRIKELFETVFKIGFVVHNPMGEPYNETRIDLDANIAGEGVENLVVVEVIKPIIRLKQSGFNQLVQKGIVIVESDKN